MIGAAKKVNKRLGDVGGVEDLEDEAAEADAELEGCHGVLGVGVGVGAPFDVEADYEVVARTVAAVMTVLAEDVGDPVVDLGGGGGEKGVDGVGVEGDVVEVVGVVWEVVVDDADHGAFGCWGVFR